MSAAHGADPVFFSSAADFRRWLETNCDCAAFLVVGLWKQRTGRSGMTYREALDEALCFGWIDGVRRRIDDECYSIRFTPRRSRSNWSRVNIERTKELVALGRMTEAGRNVFEGRDRNLEGSYSFENKRQALDGESESRFRANATAWAFFSAQPASYRRTAIWWVVSAKREETRRRRLLKLIADSAEGRRLAMLETRKGKRND